MSQSILNKKQVALLEEFSRYGFLTDNFYLTGGTALAEFYLHHRFSEDLDFFSEKEIDPLALDIFLKSIRERLNISKIDFQQSYNRNIVFLYFNSEVVKTEFTFYPFPRIESAKQEMGLQIDSLLDIAVNKLFTIYQRSAARDYIDLYCIVEKGGFQIADLVSKAKIKFDWHIDPVQLGTQFIKASQVKDYPKLIQPLAEKDWQNFFIEEAKKLKPQIFE